MILSGVVEDNLIKEPISKLIKKGLKDMSYNYEPATVSLNQINSVTGFTTLKETGIAGWLGNKANQVDAATGRITQKIDDFGDAVSKIFNVVATGVENVKDAATGAKVEVRPNNTVYVALAAVLGVWLITSMR